MKSELEIIWFDIFTDKINQARTAELHHGRGVVSAFSLFFAYKHFCLVCLFAYCSEPPVQDRWHSVRVFFPISPTPVAGSVGGKQNIYIDIPVRSSSSPSVYCNTGASGGTTAIELNWSMLGARVSTPDVMGQPREGAAVINRRDWWSGSLYF